MNSLKKTHFCVVSGPKKKTINKQTNKQTNKPKTQATRQTKLEISNYNLKNPAIFKEVIFAEINIRE